MTIKYNVESKKGKLVISEKTANYKIDLRERLVDFAVNTIKFLGTIPYRKEYDVIRYQLSVISYQKLLPQLALIMKRVRPLHQRNSTQK